MRAGAALLVVAGAAPSCKSSNGSGKTSSPLCTAAAPGPAPLRRLTRFEIGRSLSDILGTDPALVDDLPPDEESDGYDNSSAAYSVSPLHAEKLLDLGESAAAALIADGARLRGFAACDPTADGAGCVSAFIRALGGRLWRRPLDDGEVSDLTALSTAAGASDPRAGVTAVIAAMVQSPGFIYRAEAPASAGAKLPVAALAARLAFLVTSSAPDAALLAAVADGSLATSAGLDAQTDRLLATPHAVEAFEHFVNEWWELDSLPAVEKDTSLFRSWNDTLPAAFAEETRRFLDDAWQNGPTLKRLFTGATTYADLNLADFYGYPLPSQPGFQPIAVDPAARRRALQPGRVPGDARQGRPDVAGPARQVRALAAALRSARAATIEPRDHAAGRRSAQVDARALPGAHRRRVLRRLSSS